MIIINWLETNQNNIASYPERRVPASGLPIGVPSGTQAVVSSSSREVVKQIRGMRPLAKARRAVDGISVKPVTFNKLLKI